VKNTDDIEAGRWVRRRGTRYSIRSEVLEVKGDTLRVRDWGYLGGDYGACGVKEVPRSSCKVICAPRGIREYLTYEQAFAAIEGEKE